MKYLIFILYITLSISLLVYMLVPGTTSVQDLSQLPNATLSTLPGDVWQVSNIKAFFSDTYREDVTDYYYQDYINNNPFPFDPISLNYPPEQAYTYVKDQTRSTYLEEYVYPLRDSVFVNGMEPFTQEGEARFVGATEYDFGGENYETKIILRYYPSNLIVRLTVWIGIITSTLFVFLVGRRVLLNKNSLLKKAS